MKIPPRLTSLAGCLLITAALGCGSEASDRDDFADSADSPFRLNTSIDIRLERDGNVRLYVAPAIEGKSICRQTSTRHAIDAEILTPDTCRFGSMDDTRMTDEAGYFAIYAASQSTEATCRVELTYPQGNGGQGVTQTLDLTI